MDFGDKLLELTRRGEHGKVKWFKNFDKTILPSQLKRLVENDKSVWREIVAPDWCSYALLRDWALAKVKHEEEKKCVLCDHLSSDGTAFNEKFICKECHNRLKESE